MPSTPASPLSSESSAPSGLRLRCVVSPALGANCYILAPASGSECVLIDPGYLVADEVREVLAADELTAVAVLITHGHLDHIAGVGDLTGLPVLIHDDDAYRLADPFAQLSPELASLVEAQFGGRQSWSPPSEVRTFTAGEVLQLAGLQISAVHAPGHTEGATLFRVARAPDGIQLPEGEVVRACLFTGDVLFAGSVGRTDLHGGDQAVMEHTLSAVVLGEPDDTLVLPGHGPATTIGRERRSNPFLQQL